MNTEVMFSSKTDLWETPQEFFDELDAEFHTPPNEPLTPCDVCMYNPPSIFGGKPCFMCPAASRPPEGEEDT